MMTSGTVRNAATNGTENNSVKSKARRCDAIAPGVIARRQPPRHFRQQHRADRDPDHADRQLIEPVGIIQRRQRARRQEGRDDGVGEQRDLRAHRAQRRGPERAKEGADVVIELERRKARQAAMAREIAGQQEILQEAGDQHAPGRGVAGGRERTPPAPASPSSTRLRKIDAAAALAKRCMTLSMPP